MRHSPFPWAMGQMQQAPIGLRESVARIAYLTPQAVAHYARVAKPSLLRTVARWRVEQPVQWQQLLEAVR